MLGLQFETLVLNHVDDLFPHLGLDRALVLSAAPYVKRAGTDGPGCQIDLLVQAERTALVVEIKRRREIGRDVIEEVEAKTAALKVAKGLSV